MQENRPFDNFFWTWPGQTGYNANLCMPLNPNKLSAGCLTPRYWANPVVPHDLPHTWTASWNAYNNGSMNGFLSEAGDSPEVMTYYNATILGNVWSLASHYTLADEWFTSVKVTPSRTTGICFPATSRAFPFGKCPTGKKSVCIRESVNSFDMCVHQ